eukprot:349604-Chlamydomonas_euryale.AAC.3
MSMAAEPTISTAAKPTMSTAAEQTVSIAVSQPSTTAVDKKQRTLHGRVTSCRERSQFGYACQTRQAVGSSCSPTAGGLQAIISELSQSGRHSCQTCATSFKSSPANQ